MQTRTKHYTITLVNTAIQMPIRSTHSETKLKIDQDLWALPGGKVLSTETLTSQCVKHGLELVS